MPSPPHLGEINEHLQVKIAFKDIWLGRIRVVRVRDRIRS
jgi:hypothetical protein